MRSPDTIDLDAIFRVLTERLVCDCDLDQDPNRIDCHCIAKAEYLGQRRHFEKLLAEAESATPKLKKHADVQLKQIDKLARNIGKALDALEAIDPALLALLAAQSGDLEQFREHAARLKAAALPPDSLAVHCAKLPRKRWPSQGDADW